MQTERHHGRKVLATASLVWATFLCACAPSVSSESTSPNDSDETVKATQRLPESMSGEAFLDKNKTLPPIQSSGARPWCPPGTKRYRQYALRGDFD